MTTDISDAAKDILLIDKAWNLINGASTETIKVAISAETGREYSKTDIRKAVKDLLNKKIIIKDGVTGSGVQKYKYSDCMTYK